MITKKLPHILHNKFSEALGMITNLLHLWSTQLIIQYY